MSVRCNECEPAGDHWVEPNKGAQSFTALSNVIISNELWRMWCPQNSVEIRGNPRDTNPITH
jgi:hypothetical protein